MPGLDGMRALAVFAVIAYHLSLAWVPGGLLGVNLFFVLSGYLITNLLLVQWERTGKINYKDFWLRRTRRLLPALLVMLAVVTIWLVFYAPERVADLKGEMLAAVSYTSNWYLILHDVSYFENFGPPSPLGHLWSLAVEGQFYLFWPFLLGLGLRYFSQRKWIIVGTMVVILISFAAMALIYTPGHDPSRVYYGTDTRAFALLAGALLAVVLPSWGMNTHLSGKRRLALDLAGMAGLAVVLLMIWKTNQYQTSLYQGGLLAFSVASALLVAVLAHPASQLGRFFSWGPLRWLGKWSYGIYLWHYPVIMLTGPVVNTGGPEPMLVFWQIMVSIALAALSYYLVEVPVRYGRSRRLRGRTAASRRRPRPLARSARISMSVLLMFLVLAAIPNEGAHISAKDLPGGSKTQNSAPAAATVEDPVKDQVADPVGDPVEDPPAGPVEDPAGDQVAGGEDTVASQEPGGLGNDSGKGITVIGDSLMIDVAPVLEESLPGIIVDTQIGRQMYQAPGVIDQLRQEGRLGQTVIIGLGTNGSFTKEQLAETIDSLPDSTMVILVNTRVPKPWETVVNETLAGVPASYPQVRLADWYAASKGRDDYFYADGVHLNQAGVQAYGDMIIAALKE